MSGGGSLGTRGGCGATVTCEAFVHLAAPVRRRPRGASPAWSRACRSFASVVIATLAVASSVGAQVRDTVPVSAAAIDSLEALALPRPPISPRRAFVTSFLLPGYAQARLDRPTASAVFFGIEAASVLMLGKTLHDLRVARRFRADSVPATYELDDSGAIVRDDTGAPVVATWAPGRYTEAVVRARRLQVEDWIAAILFNHLFSGAEAFVSAHLWDVPAALSFRPTAGGGAAVSASVRW